MTAARVFLSYSHDSPEHRRRVLALAEKLRADGIDATVDQYFEPAGPPEGWPQWTETQLRTADFVLAVCSPTYRRRVEGDDQAGEGHGVVWEGKLIYQHIYNAASQNRKFIPVLLGESKRDDIPLPLQGVSSHCPEDPEGYDSLCRTLTGAAAVTRAQLGEAKSRAPLALPRTRRSYTIRLGLVAAVLAALLAGIWLWRHMPAEYNVQVSVVDPNGAPAATARVTASVPADVLRSDAGWTIRIPGSSVPDDRMVLVRAADPEAFLVGEENVPLRREAKLSATIRLSARTDAKVRGNVLDAASRAVPGARVSIAGQNESALTDANGAFELPAHAAAGQTVVLLVEKDGYKPVQQTHPAGSTSAMVVIDR